MSFAPYFNGLLSSTHNRTDNIHDMDQNSSSSFQSNRARAPSSSTSASTSSNNDDPIFRELEYADEADHETLDAVDGEIDVDAEILETTASITTITAVATSDNDTATTTNNDINTTIANTSHGNTRNNSNKHHTANAPEAKKLSAQEKRIRSILLEALPVNSFVTDESLDRLSRAFKAFVSEASSAAATKAASLASSAAGAAKAPTAPRSASSSSKGAAAKVAANKAHASSKKPAVLIKKPSATNNLTLRGTRQAPTHATGKTGAISKSSAKSKGKPHKVATPASKVAVAREEDVQMEEVQMEEVQMEEEEEEEEEEDDKGAEYEVEKILDHRHPRGRRTAYQFRLKWKGYSESESTWEDKSALDHCQELLREYAEENDLEL